MPVLDGLRGLAMLMVLAHHFVAFRPLHPVEKWFVRVAELDDEFVDAEMRASLLRRIADETGGRFYTPANTRSLAADVALSRRGVTTVNEMDLWDMPINFLLLVVLFSAEWGFRKLRGLA